MMNTDKTIVHLGWEGLSVRRIVSQETFPDWNSSWKKRQRPSYIYRHAIPPRRRSISFLFWRPFMKKRGIFSLVVLLAHSTLFQHKSHWHRNCLRTGHLWPAFADAETNSYPPLHHKQRPKLNLNAHTTAERSKSHWTNFNPMRTWSLQTVVTEEQLCKEPNLLDGVLISQLSGSVDLSIILSASLKESNNQKRSRNLGRPTHRRNDNIITKQAPLLKTPTPSPLKTDHSFSCLM